MPWEVPAKGVPGSLPLPGCLYLAWAPVLLPLEKFLFTLSTQVDAQLTGSISQKEERGTKVELGGGRWGEEFTVTWSALCTLCKPLE